MWSKGVYGGQDVSKQSQINLEMAYMWILSRQNFNATLPESVV